MCVLASAMNDWLLCRVGRFALSSLQHRGDWPLLPVVPLPGYCFDGIPACIGFPSSSYACLFCMLLVVVVCLPLLRICVFCRICTA